MGDIYVRFFNKAVHQVHLSKQEGRPIYKTIPYIEKHVPGGKSVVCRPAYDIDKQKFPKQLEAFLENKEVIDGIPLDEVGFLTLEQRATLKDLKVFTLEQLAELSENVIKKVGMGGYGLVKKAKELIAQNSGTDKRIDDILGILSNIQEKRLEKGQVADLKEQIMGVISDGGNKDSRFDGSGDELSVSG